MKITQKRRGSGEFSFSLDLTMEEFVTLAGALGKVDPRKVEEAVRGHDYKDVRAWHLCYELYDQLAGELGWE